MAEEVINLTKQLLCTNWCVCCEEKVYAEYIYAGYSLCPKHFKEVNKNG